LNEGTDMRLKEILSNVFDMLEKASEVDPKGVVLTGYHEIDQLTGGLKPGELSLILTGEEGLGRTFAENVILNHLDLSILVFCLDISKEQYGMELLSIKSQVSFDAIRLVTIDQADWDKLSRATDDLSISNIQIIDKKDITIRQIRTEIEKANKNEPLNLIVIDIAENDYKASRLKTLSKTLNIPIVLVSDSNICSSKMIECADLVFELDDAWKLGCIAAVEVGVSKNTWGLTGMVGLNYSEEFTRFKSMN